MNKKAKFILRNEKHKKIIIKSKYLWKPEGPEENHMTKYYITKLVDLVLDGIDTPTPIPEKKPRTSLPNWQAKCVKIADPNEKHFTA